MSFLYADVRIGELGNNPIFPKIVSDGGHYLYAIWWENYTKLLFNYSLDNGTTWQAKNISIGRASSNYDIWCDRIGNAYVLWIGLDSCVYLTAFSNYGGMRETRKFEAVAGEKCTAWNMVFLTGDHQGRLYTVFRSNVGEGLYLYISSDLGKSWRRTSLSSMLQADDMYGFSGDFAGTIYILSYKDKTYYLSRSSDQGISWPVLRKKITSDPLTGVTIHSDSSGIFYFVWTTSLAGKTNVYLDCSRDFGVTWSVRGKSVNQDPDGQYPLSNPRISADAAGNVYIVWLKNDALFYNSSRDFGETWHSNDTKLDEGKEGNEEWIRSPYIMSDSNGGVSIIWMLARFRCVYDDVISEIRRQYSADFGRHWLPFTNVINNLRKDIATSPHPYYPIAGVAGSSGEINIIWSAGKEDAFDPIEIDFARCRVIQPPSNIQVEYQINRTLFHKEHYDTITWDDNPLNEGVAIQAYVICWKHESDSEYTFCFEGEKAKTVDASAHAYSLRYPITEERRVYSVYSVDEWGVFSPVSAWNIGQ